ncbi:MAG: M48 family metalloprotease [Planctomycetes bacterium]|nr:M48 family metalloprotease [Planctomycetota bacterium]
MSWLVANTVVAAAIALLAVAIGRWLRPAPVVMHGLWLVVLLKLVTPPLWSVEVGTAPAPRPPVVLPLTSPMSPDSIAVAAATLPVVAAPAVAPARPVDWRLLAAIAWALGSAVMAWRIAGGLLRVRRHLRSLAPAAPRVAREVEGLARQLGVRMPIVLDDPTARSPFVVGLLRSRLVVSSAGLLAASDKGRAAVLVHELAHLRRGDHWLAHGELLLAVALWWHPLFWLARRELRHHAELAADAWAIASVPDATIDYAAVLVQAVAPSRSAVSAPTVLAASTVAGSAFETRLTMILNENVPCRASRAWWLPFTTLALGLFTTPVLAQSKEPDPVQVEIRINGKEVEELSGAERTALLKKLLAAEEQAEKPAKKPKAAEQKPKRKAKPALEPLVPTGEPESLQPLELGELLRSGLAEAKLEILADEGLKELGLDDDVCQLLDDLGSGRSIDGSIEAIVKAAMDGVMPMVEKELRADPDLKQSGLTDGVLKLVRGFLGDARNQDAIGELVRKATGEAMAGVQLQLLDDADLQQFVGKARKSAESGAGLMLEVAPESIEVVVEEPAAKPVKKAKKAKGKKKSSDEIR